MIQKRIVFLFIFIFLLSCEDEIYPISQKTQKGNNTVSGRATFDKVNPNDNYKGLNYNNIEKISIKNATIKIFDKYDNLVNESKTDENGEYLFNEIPIQFKIIIYANTISNGSEIIKVVDNTTANKALYVIETEVYNRDKDTILNINAPSGWNSSLNYYDKDRSAAPFAILDSIRKGMATINRQEDNIPSSLLIINWSKKNRAAGPFSAIDGHILSSSYNKYNGNLWILGDSNSDTDEYDEFIILHEWSHFFEDKLSRTDNIGGMHNQGEKLDMRIAFSEGLANALSGIILEDKNYYDTMGSFQSKGWTTDLSINPSSNKGWFIESSIHSILYNIFLKYGFDSIYKTLRFFHPEQLAFISIFTFVTGFNLYEQEEISNILDKENISPINDIYGKTLINNPMYKKQSLYTELILNNSKEICIKSNIERNKLGHYLYGYFNLETSAKYQIFNNLKEYAKLNIFKLDINKRNLESLDLSNNKTIQINKGYYLFELDNIDYNNHCFNLMLRKKSENE